MDIEEFIGNEGNECLGAARTWQRYDQISSLSRWEHFCEMALTVVEMIVEINSAYTIRPIKGFTVMSMNLFYGYFCFPLSLKTTRPLDFGFVETLLARSHVFLVLSNKSTDIRGERFFPEIVTPSISASNKTI